MPAANALGPSIGALLLPDGALLLGRRDGLLLLARWDAPPRAAWVTEDGTSEPFTQRVVLFDRRGVWLWPSPLLHEDPDAGGRADLAAYFAAIPLIERLRRAEEPVAFEPLVRAPPTSLRPLL
ncbi:hypothetical protein [Roseospira navarrensis]|uniref:Uncharacterized protein n=1 Tax=Roseospira navarrensis TaxID=140058 RepID=A0A7X1ZG96_9PROT|nr:hypothetical protein [Roseospira navarrensis]MQX37812.1 hypothetical protein [Roseospira navarrensis]